MKIANISYDDIISSREVVEAIVNQRKRVLIDECETEDALVFVLTVSTLPEEFCTIFDAKDFVTEGTDDSGRFTAIDYGEVELEETYDSLRDALDRFHALVVDAYEDDEVVEDEED